MKDKRIWIEFGMVPEWQEHDNGTFTLVSLSYPGSTWNVLPYMDKESRIIAEARLDDLRMQMLEDAQTAIRERREMRADRHRELALEERREHLRASQSQSGVKL